MALEDTMRSLREFDLNDLDFDNVGSWPMPIKVFVWVAILAGVLALGYYYHIEDLQLQLANEEKREESLKKEFEKKAFQAANLDAYRKQLAEMEETFGALVSQLPSDTEVPGLLEDITNKGLLNGLSIASIDLQPEQAKVNNTRQSENRGLLTEPGFESVRCRRPGGRMGRDGGRLKPIRECR